MKYPVQVEVQDTGRQEEVTQSPNGDQIQKSFIDPKLNENSSRFRSDMDKANIINRLFFGYGIKPVYKAFRDRNDAKKYPDEELISTIPWKQRPDVLSDRISLNISQRQRKKPHKKINLKLAVLKAVKWPLIKTLVGETIFVSARLFSTYVIKRLVQAYIDQDTPEAYHWSIVLTGCLILGFFSEHYWNFKATYFPTIVKNALVDLLYGKITRLSTYSLIKLSSGRLINLASNSLNFLEQFGLFFPSILVGIYALIVGGVIVWQSFGVCTLVGLGYIVFWWPLQGASILLSTKTRDQTTELTNNRVKTTSETIEGIRLFKMYAWEMKFKEKIEGIRIDEMKLLKGTAIGQATARAIAFSVQNCGTFLLFIAYVYSGSGTLNVADVFSTYFVFGYLRIFSSYFIGGALIFMTEASVCFKNIEKVLAAPEIGDVEFEQPENRENSIEFSNFTAYWVTDDPNDAPEVVNEIKTKSENKKLVETDIKPTLYDINLKLKKGSLNALVGTVGSGKTSFLMSFTGEMPKTTGSLKYKGTIAYVEQEPTIFAGTLKENVIFGRPYDDEWYQKVVKACSLSRDIKLFDKGDEAEVVEGGNNLSGGQKARLALARAVYSKADIYLLDDPLSAVDPKVARNLYKNCIDGILKGKTIILVTHQVDYVRNCENIIVMENGHVLGSGTMESLSDQNIHPEKIFGDKPQMQEPSLSRGGSLEDKPEPALSRGVTSLTRGVSHENKPDLRAQRLDSKTPARQKVLKDKEQKDQKEPLTKEEKDSIDTNRYAGKVTVKTYTGLLKEMGGIPMGVLLLAIIVSSQFSIIAYGRILGAWIAGTFPQWKSVAILGGLVGFDIFIFNAVFLSIGLSTLRAARRYHKKMLNRVIRATVLFFDTNSLGGVIDRFSTDIGTLDRFIPLAMTDVLNISAFLCTIIITSGIIYPVLLGPLLAALFVAIILFFLCYPSIERTKLYELRTKGPVYDLLSATLSGVVIMRIYNQVGSFRKKFREHLHKTTKGNFTFCLSFRIAGFFADMAYTLAVIGCIFISTAHSSSGEEQSYLAAFSLALILGVTGLFQHGLRQMSALNISMASVARVQEYCDAPLEPPLSLQTDDNFEKNKWPQKGEIEMSKVYMKYRPDADYVIKDLNLEVKPGEKIGCVGRTGAGKSTIVQLLYRMREIEKKGRGSPDSYIKIDNVNTQTLGLHLLRSNLSMIPQTPYIFSGSVRNNIDPLGQCTDEQIWSVLEDVRLKDHIDKQNHKLDTLISSGAAIFSVGQKQLVCLARAILKPSKVLIMDEATANMDYDTDNFLQDKIGERFENSTRFTIAHRLTTIASYDKVLVLSKGRKVEFDEPYKLLVQNIGDEEMTNFDGHFSIMVQNTGPISSQQIFEIARNSYFERHNMELKKKSSINN